MVAEGISQDFAHIANAFAALFGSGGFSGFFKELFQAIDGIGVFLVIYALMMFIGRITLFKAEEHKSYANMFGIGIAIVAVTVDDVYNLLTGVVAGTFLQLVIILFVVFAIIILLKNLRKHSYSASEGLNNAHASALQSEGEVAREKTETRKIENELKAQRRLDRREFIARGDTKKAGKRLERSAGDSFGLLEQIKHELNIVSNLQSQGKATQALRQGIFDKINAFVSSLHKEYTNTEKLKSRVDLLRAATFKEIRLDLVENKDFDHLFAIFQAIKDKKHGAPTPLTGGEKSLIESYALKSLNLEKTKSQIIEDVERRLADAETNLSETNSIKGRLTAALQSGDIQSASSAVSSMEQHLVKIRDEDAKINADMARINASLDQIKKYHVSERTALINKLHKLHY